MKLTKFGQLRCAPPAAGDSAQPQAWRAVLRRCVLAFGVIGGLIAPIGTVAVAAEKTAPKQVPEHARLMKRLISAYPDFLAGYEGNEIIWRDGTRMAFDDGIRNKPFEALLNAPDLQDQFYAPYPAGGPATAPARNIDPGRVRFEPFFEKMYGNCRRGGVARNLRPVKWLPNKGGGVVEVTKVNGVADALEKVSRALDKLPARYNVFLVPSAGTYNCRSIAGTDRSSVHAFGAAIDISTSQSDYWRWSKPRPDGTYAYSNKIPMEIVEIFERHGFIWGGRWYHYDTMHFEYRPELLPARN